MGYCGVLRSDYPVPFFSCSNESRGVLGVASSSKSSSVIFCDVGNIGNGVETTYVIHGFAFDSVLMLGECEREQHAMADMVRGGISDREFTRSTKEVATKESEEG